MGVSTNEGYLLKGLGFWSSRASGVRVQVEVMTPIVAPIKPEDYTSIQLSSPTHICMVNMHEELVVLARALA